MDNITHVNVKTIEAATAELAKGNAQVIAGGTDLLTSLKGFISDNLPTTIVNIKKIPDMTYIKEEGGMLKIGALTTLTTIANSSLVKDKYTVLAEAAQAVGSPELRNMGTIGGNICQRPRCIYYRNEYNDFNCLRKNPAGTCYALLGINRYHSIFGGMAGCVAPCPSDTAPALVALGAKIVTSKDTWEATDFFGLKGEQINNLDADEIVTEIQVSTPASGTKSAYRKFAFRKAIDFPLVSAAVVIGGGEASIVLGGVNPTPVVATAAQDSIKGKTIDDANAEAAGAAAVTGTAGVTDQNRYKIQITKVMVKRAILACK